MFFFQPKPTTVEILEGIDKVGGQNAASMCAGHYGQCFQVLSDLHCFLFYVMWIIFSSAYWYGLLSGN